MEESEEKNKGFKVQDRRRFSAEGDARPEAPEDTAAKAQSSPAAHTITEPPPAAPRNAAPRATELTFSAFVMSLSAQAMLHLGEIPDPASGQPLRDLEAAQELIDILGLLQDKTRGNLDLDESQLLTSILYGLRMKYVEVARHPAGH